VIPLPPGSTSTSPSAPDGTVLNTTTGFVISEDGRSAPATSIFATEDGTISAWNQQVDPNNALLEVDNSGAGAVFKALTVGSNTQGTFLFATDFHNGTVDVFDSHFHQVQLAGSFSDPNIPRGFAPFGIKNVNGTLFVTYAKQLAPDNHDDQAGPGNGFIDEFDTNGNLIERFASQGPLNSPHGIALAPADFGAFSNALLVGNFGDGRINAFDLKTGNFLGTLSDAAGRPIINVGIWGMTFGNGAGGTDKNTLYFAAGINGENDGLFGSISLANPDKAGGVGEQDHGQGRGRDSASGGQKALDRLFALVGRSAEGQAIAGLAQQATPSASESPDAKAKQVTAPAPEQQGSGLTANVAARHHRSGPGSLDLFNDTDRWSF
jgi:uncharacterized protein (TIGR03118 family)